MNGFYFDFETNDLVIDDEGAFETANISSQNCALISTSQVCKITAPQVGEQLAVKILNRKNKNVSKFIRDAEKAVRNDGGTEVDITLDDSENLTFKAIYES